MASPTDNHTITFVTSANENTRHNVDYGISDPVVQYILVRTDLNWSTGALIAQACHASVASIFSTLNNSTTKRYLNDMESMHKVILKAEKLDDITNAESKLKEANIAHHVWIERPENVISCLAVSPQPKHIVQSIFKHLKLLR